jgi:hypothetical protein
LAIKLELNSDKHYDIFYIKINRLERKTRDNNEKTMDKKPFYPRICNMTQIRLTNEEEALLENGSKYNIGIPKVSIDNTNITPEGINTDC